MSKREDNAIQKLLRRLHNEGIECTNAQIAVYVLEQAKKSGKQCSLELLGTVLTNCLSDELCYHVMKEELLEENQS